MSTTAAITAECKERMDKSIENLKKEFSRIRTGRATPALLEGITVDYYGTPTPVNQVGTVSIPDARLIMIQPWDKGMLGAVEKAIMASNIGLTPQNDGNVIRLPIPPLSEERRQELAKNGKKTAEDAKVAVRNIRRDANEKAKKAEKDKDITQDEQKKVMDDIQKITDGHIGTIDELFTAKEKEILEV